MKFSIITVCLNDRTGLVRTIQSVSSQSYKDFEFIIIDGGSTDGSADVIHANEDHVDYWVSESDNGIYDGMNKGVAASSGDYCIFLNSGDTFFSEDVLKNVVDHLEGDIICGDAMLVGHGAFWRAPDVVDEHFWRQRNSICHQSVFIRTALLKDTQYDTSLKIASDYKFFFYELVVERRIYKRINITVCNYGCDGISSNHERSDAEKKRVIDEFVQKGYILEDPLVAHAKRLKIGSRRYRLALWILSRL